MAADQDDYAEAVILRAAAGILQQRSRKPRSIMLTVITRVLRETADRIAMGYYDEPTTGEQQ